MWLRRPLAVLLLILVIVLLLQFFLSAAVMLLRTEVNAVIARERGEPLKEAEG